MSCSVVGKTEIAEEILPVFEGDDPFAIIAVFMTFLKFCSMSVYDLDFLSVLLFADLLSAGFLPPTFPLALVLITDFLASLLKD